MTPELEVTPELELTPELEVTPELDPEPELDPDPPVPVGMGSTSPEQAAESKPARASATGDRVSRVRSMGTP